MICPECDHNQLRGREGMTCKKCSYEFCFDPKKDLCGAKSVTDGFFIKCIDKLSRNNTYFYTEDELYCFMAQKVKPGLIGSILGSIAVTIFICLFMHIALQTSIWPATILLPILIFFSFSHARKPLKRKHWKKLLSKWQLKTAKYKQQQNVLAGLISFPTLTNAPAQQSEPDIYDYGASKLLICQDDIQVDWLVKNDFHTKNGIVIVAESGYPHYLADLVKNIVANNPELEIHLLHNAGQSGKSMATRVQYSTTFGDISQHSLNDLGIDLDQLQNTKIKPFILEEYYGDFPAHGLNYHQFSNLLVHCITTGGTLAAAALAYEASSDFGISCDFG